MKNIYRFTDADLNHANIHTNPGNIILSFSSHCKEYFFLESIGFPSICFLAKNISVFSPMN